VDGSQGVLGDGVPLRVRRGHARPAHQVLRVHLGGLDSRGGGGGTEGRNLGEAERIDETGGQRTLRSHDHEVDTLLARQRHDRFAVCRAHGHATANLCDSGVARRGNDLRRGVVAADLPGEGVLATAPADEQDLHFGRFWNASLKASRALRTMSPTCPTTVRA
jgi:hypothetical protein